RDGGVADYAASDSLNAPDHLEPLFSIRHHGLPVVDSLIARSITDLREATVRSTAGRREQRSRGLPTEAHARWTDERLLDGATRRGRSILPGCPRQPTAPTRRSGGMR